MNRKRKAATALMPQQASGFIERVVDTVMVSVLATSTALLAAILVMTALQSTSHSTAYRFCLATETADSCVHRPGKSFGKKTYQTPDKLLDYFGSIPERVQQQWRVWVMDEEKSSTTELTVAEFYAWIDTVWHPLQVEA